MIGGRPSPNPHEPRRGVELSGAARGDRQQKKIRWRPDTSDDRSDRKFNRFAKEKGMPIGVTVFV